MILINGNGAPPRGPIDIVVEKDQIVKIVNVGYPGIEIKKNRRPVLQKGGKEIDANGMFLLPGFIDMHGHIGGIAQGADWEYVFKLWYTFCMHSLKFMISCWCNCFRRSGSSSETVGRQFSGKHMY